MSYFDQPFGSGALYSSHAVNTNGIAVEADESANTKGEWVTILSNLPFDTALVYLTIHSASDTGNYLLDLGFNDGSNSYALVNNISINMLDAQRRSIGQLAAIPIFIKKGNALVARIQDPGGSRIIYINATAIPTCFGLPYPFTKSITYGVNTGTSLPTAVDPGGTAGAYGAWVTLASSTTNPVKCFYVVTNLHSGTIVSSAWSLSLGLGDTPNNIWPDFTGCTGRASVSILPMFHGPYFVNWPAGIKIKMRTSCSTNSFGSRLLGVSLLTFG